MTMSPPQTIELVTPFPQPGQLVELAYRDLDTAAGGSPEQTRLLGSLNALPRPWNPASCTNPRLWAQLEDWLHRVAAWLNKELCWQPSDILPLCWPRHPPLVHELALLADRRRTAEAALYSDQMEYWHHTNLPAYLTRVRADTASCVTDHRDWPGRTRNARQPWLANSW